MKRAVTDKEGKFALKHFDPAMTFRLLVVAEGRVPIFSDKSPPYPPPSLGEGRVGAGPVKFSLVLGPQVRPLPVKPTDADLDRIFTDLDNHAFKTREKASRELAAFGEWAVPGVRKRLERRLSAEVRWRAAAFLDQFDPAELSPPRAVAWLEEIATPAAKELLAELAKGPTEAPSTLDAAAALTRLARKPAGQP